ncbi:MAG: hypothetical protein LBV59_13395 [Sphingobacterium sp.]|jgi:hypothetical protein|uniref:hypothetical protein n=1 Tax=Sphingobacterium sp. TaxID=341027 RepID=UPI0028509910|nr:hypothetical protein [Sphingobacterium sp.]MDR3008929.1 hypothetical protein [Sphingobacterium sp.]
MKKVYQIVNGIALVITVIINYLSNTGIFNGETMATISAKYQNLFTPSGYAFSIWGIIYLGLMGFVVYYGPFAKQTAEKDKVTLNIGWWFLISCLTNSLWVIAWLYDYTFWTILLMVLLFVSLLKIIQLTCDVNNSTVSTAVFFKLPFSMYAGWISVALIADIAAYLTKIGWSGFGISDTIWTLIMFVIALLIHLFMIWRRRMPMFALVAVWALIAIAVANKVANGTVYTGALIAAVIVLLNVIVFYIQYPKSLLN